MTTIRKVGIVCFAFAALCPGVSAEEGGEAIRQTLQAYEQAWSRHDAHAIAGFYFEPAMRVSTAGPVVRPTQADQETFFDGYLRGMVERGYDRSEWESLEVRMIDPQTGLASGITVRFRADGSVLERVAVTYSLWSTDKGWKIFLSATHAPENALHFR